MTMEVRNLSFSYDNNRIIFSDVSFNLEKGVIFCILGANGSGKSTLLNCLVKLLKPKSGAIMLNGRDTREMTYKDIAQVVAYVPQTYSPSFDYAVRDFVVMGRAPYISTFQRPKQADYSIADEAIKMLKLDHLADRPYTQISGGERQQVNIARALVQQPEIIFFDEPTNHLDYGNQLRVLKLMKSFAKKGYAIIMTTHNPDHVILLEGKVGILNQNGLMITGDCSEILDEKRICDIYSKIKNGVCQRSKQNGSNI